jgi:hypothetical protein
MPLFPRPSSPAAVWADLKAFARERSRVQWMAAVVAVVMPMLIVAGFYHDSRANLGTGEQLIYVDSWTANRTDAEIVADQQKRQAEQEAYAAERQRQFQKLENQLGF